MTVAVALVVVLSSGIAVVQHHSLRPRLKGIGSKSHRIHLDFMNS